MIRIFYRVLFIFALISTVGIAHAQTSFDAGGVNGGAIRPGWSSDTCDSSIEGAIRYNSGTSCAEYCNGSNWTCPVSGGGAPDCTNDSTITCTLEATRSNDDAQFSASNIVSGVNILGVTGTYSGSDVCSPSSFTFTDVSNANANAVYTTSAKTLSGITGPCFAVLGADSSAELLVNGTPTGNMYAFVNNGDTVAIRMTSSLSLGTTASAELAIGAFRTDWDVTTDSSCPAGTGSQNYTSFGSYTYSVSAAQVGCTFAVTVKGAGGGRGDEPAEVGGTGGGVSFDFIPSAVGDFDVVVGQAGADSGGTARYGGGAGGNSFGGSGGGASALKFAGDLLAVSGGGGGGGDGGADGGDGGGGNDCGQDGQGSGGNYGCSNIGGTYADSSTYNAGGSAGSNGYGGFGAGAGIAAFQISGGGRGTGADAGGGGGGYGAGSGADSNGGGAGGGGFLDTDLVEAGYSVIGGSAEMVDGAVTLSWGP